LLTSASNQLSKTTAVSLALLAIACGTGCGTSATNPTVVRIGNVSIDRSTVRHWEQAIKLGPGTSASSRSSRQSARTQALQLEIMAAWLTGEASRKYLTVSSAAVKQRADELGKLTATGRATIDAEFVAKMILTAQKIRAAVLSSVAPAGEAEIASYYTMRHRPLSREEVRTADLIEGLKSRSAGLAFVKRFGTGRQFASRSTREYVHAQAVLKDAHTRGGGLGLAIYAAPLHKLGGPIRYLGHWAMFVVRAVNPGPYILPAGATAVVNRVRQRAALDAFFARYQREWKAKTICDRGFIVANCSEVLEELPPSANPLIEQTPTSGGQ
jgi:hypothetical protein